MQANHSTFTRSTVSPAAVLRCLRLTPMKVADRIMMFEILGGKNTGLWKLAHPMQMIDDDALSIMDLNEA